MFLPFFKTIRFFERLNKRLEKDLVAHIVRKEVVTEAIDGMYEEKQRGRNKNLTRLLG